MTMVVSGIRDVLALPGPDCDLHRGRGVGAAEPLRPRGVGRCLETRVSCF